MNEIINVTNQTPIEVLLQVGEDGKVSARDAYAFLELAPQHFARWCKTNIDENQFAESDADYSVVTIYGEVATPTGGVATRALQDYRLSVPFAKKLCMLSKTERGEQARDYFIKVEKTLQRVALSGGFQIPQTLPDALRLAADYAERNQQLEQTIKEQRPKVQLAEAVTASENSISINELAKILNQNGIDIGRNRLMAWLRNNGYLCKTRGDEYNLPTQRSADMDILEVDEYNFERNGIVYTNFTPKVTRKGQAYFIQKFCYDREVAK